jgi:hypothetical protein
MHYPPTAFSINNQPTIIARQPIPPGTVMGQRNGLSAGDIAGVHTMYPVAKRPAADTIKEVRKEPVTDTVKEVRKDPTTDTTFKEVRKEPITDTVKEVRKEPITETLKEVRKDPIFDHHLTPQPGPRPGLGLLGGTSPFVLAIGNRAPAAMGDPMSEAVEQVQQLELAIQQADQQYQQLLAAYEAAVQWLSQLQQGEGM